MFCLFFSASRWSTSFKALLLTAITEGAVLHALVETCRNGMDVYMKDRLGLNNKIAARMKMMMKKSFWNCLIILSDHHIWKGSMIRPHPPNVIWRITASSLPRVKQKHQANYLNELTVKRLKERAEYIFQVSLQGYGPETVKLYLTCWDYGPLRFPQWGISFSL